MYAFYYDKESFYRTDHSFYRTDQSSGIVNLYIEDNLNFNRVIKSLDYISVNVTLCVFLMACVISFMYNNKKYKKYEIVNTIEPKIIKGEIVSKN